MKIALVSDIHANIHALEVFLKYIDAECKVSHILNTGDFIQIGPNPREVFDIVMNDSRFISIMGNSEQMFFDEKIKKQYVGEREHQNWTVEQLGPERMERLKQLPLQRTFEAEGSKFFLVHARTASTIEMPLLYSGGNIEEFIADYDTDAGYVCIGHTHLPLYAVLRNTKTLLNPGAIGCGKDGVVRFAVIELKEALVNIEYKQLKYDKEKVIQDYRDRAVPCREKFIAMFY